MATLAQLKTRIILETNRDDMGTGGESEQALIDAYTRAIEYYADEQFWFNRLASTVATVASTATVALPTGMRSAAVVSYLGVPRLKVSLEDIEEYYNAATVTTGIPTCWAEDGNTLHFWPTPDAAYIFSVYGLADLGVPATGNAWTSEGYDLIDARARMILYRDYFRDPEGMQLAQLAETEAMVRLRRETRKRAETPARTDIMVRRRFNINTG